MTDETDPVRPGGARMTERLTDEAIDNIATGTIRTPRHDVVRYVAELHCGGAFGPGCEYEGPTLTIEVADAADAQAMLDAISSRVAPADDLRAENERLRGLVDYAASIFTHCPVTDGVCCCGDDMERHPDPMSCGHSAVDHGSYAVDQWCKQHAALLKGGDA